MGGGGRTKSAQTFTKNWDLMEFLMTSCEPPVVGVEDGQPVYQEVIEEHERERMEWYQYVSRGEIEFVKEVKRVFGEYPV